MAMTRRSGKFWFKNEAEVMEDLGLAQVPGSGSSWVAREDGSNDHILCQLKSTDANSIRVNKQDIDELAWNAAVEHKMPVFAIQFVNSNEVYLVVRPLDLPEMAKYIKSGIVEVKEPDIEIGEADRRDIKTVKSSESARERFRRQNDKKWQKKEKSAI